MSQNSTGPIASSSQRGRDTQRLIDGPISASLAKFAMPLLVTSFLHSIVGTWAAIWVSRVLDPNALTAVVTANVFMYMMMGTAMGIGTSSGVAVGQSLGANDPRAVRRVVGTSLFMVISLGCLFAATGWYFTPHILDLMGTPSAAREYALIHLRYTCLTIPSLFTYIVMMMMLRGSGDAKTPFRFTLIWIGLSLLLVPSLLTGSFGLPNLGMAGVAVGTLIANSTALLALVAYVYIRRLPIALHGEDVRLLRPDPVLLTLLFKRGLPMAAESLIVQGAYFVLLAMVNAYGANTAAAYAGAAQLWSYVQMPANALSSSMAAMVAINIGAQRWDRVEQIALRGSLLAFSICTALALLIYALGDLPLSLFIPLGSAVMLEAREINNIVLWGWIALSASLGIFGVVRGNAAMLAPTIIFALSMWIFRVPFAVLLQPMLGAKAIWWSFPFGSVCAALMAFGYYRWGAWRKNQARIVEAPASTDDGHIGE
jgi:putative MATE family efflux protein